MDFPAEVLLREPSNDPQSLPDSSGRLSSKATFTNVHHHTSFFSVVHGSKPRMSSYWLVVWTWYFSIYWEGHNPNWRFVIFSRGVGIPPTRSSYVFPPSPWHPWPHGPNGEAWSIAAACRAESVEPDDVAKTGRRREVQKHGENQGKPQDFMVKKMCPIKTSTQTWKNREPKI